MTLTLLKKFAADTTQGREVVLTSILTLTENLTIPGHIVLRIPKGCGFSVPINLTLTMEQNPVAGKYQVFYGEGQKTLLTKVCWIEWHGAVANATSANNVDCDNPTTATPSYHAFRKAKQSVGQYGTVRAGAGKFYMKDESSTFLAANGGWGRSNWAIKYHENNSSGPIYNHGLRIIAHGAVFLPEAGIGISGSVECAPYRDSGWEAQISQIHTYVDDIRKGGKTLTMRVAGTAAGFSPGDCVFINGGAAGGFDQYFGQANKVEKVIGDTIYFEKPFEKDLRAIRSSHGALVTEAFTVPADGVEIQVAITHLSTNKSNGEPIKESQPGGIDTSNNLFSIGNDLYENRGKVGTSATNSHFYNIRRVANKGNIVQPTGTVPALAKVYRRRGIQRAPSMVKDIYMEGCTVGGIRNGLRVANTMDAHFYRCKFVWRQVAVNDGLYMDSDGGYGCIMEECEFSSAGGLGNSQWARSTTNAKQIRCIFRNCYWDATEFATNIEARDCTWYLDFSELPYQKSCIRIGGTTSDIRILGGRVYTKQAKNVFNGAGVQIYGNSAGGGSIVNGLRVYLDDCRTIFDGPESGLVDFIGVRAYGNVGSLFSHTAKPPLNGLYGDDTGRFTVGSGTKVRDFHFQGEYDAFTASPFYAVDIEATVVFEGYYTVGGDAGSRARGTILRRNEDQSPLNPHDVRLVVDFWNHPYTAGGLYGSPINWNARSGARFNYLHTVKTNGAQPTDFAEAFGNLASGGASVPVTTFN